MINATGNYYKNVQSARLVQTQADDSRIDYRRRLIDEARYERMNMMTTEELRQQQLARDLQRALHQPPIDDITSAKALNDILNNLTSNPVRSKGPNIPIDDEVLQRINVTSPTQTTTSVGLLKDDGNLQWPQALLGHDFDAARNHLSQTFSDVVKGLKSNILVKSGDIKDLKTDLDQLRRLVEKSELSPTDYIAAKEYLDQVDGAVRALQDPNVGNYFNYRFSAKNVAEVVDNMSSKGLEFAPAAPGDAWAYKVLHEALAAYDYGVQPQQPATTPPAAAAPARRSRPQGGERVRKKLEGRRKATVPSFCLFPRRVQRHPLVIADETGRFQQLAALGRGHRPAVPLLHRQLVPRRPLCRIEDAGRQATAAATSSRLALGRAVSVLPCCSTSSTGRPARRTSQLPGRRSSERVPPSSSGTSNGAPEP